jgi:hypothetical protein
MTIQAVTTFIELTSANGAIEGRYQNSQVGNVISYDSKSYNYLAFIYNGATKNRTGDNMTSDLTLASNRLSMNLVAEAVQKFWTVQVDTVLMHPQTFAPVRQLSREFWIASSFGYDTQAVQLQLSSAIDAVGADAPNRTLLRKYVGALPLTSQISNR